MENIEEKKRPHIFRTLFFILVLAIILLIIYGKYLGNSGLILKQYEINDKKIPESFNNLKIAHFSDVLYKNKEDIRLFDTIIQKINDKKVDIIIFSGNLTDNNYKFNEEEANKVVEKLSKLECTYGKYYVSGKNDKNDPSFENIMIKSGFVSLNDSKDIIYSKKNEQIILMGLDYNSPGSYITEAIKNTDNIYKIITFSESDEIEELISYNFDLALASNSLNGQINIPIVKDFFIRDGSKKYISSYYKVNNTKLFVSSGIGTDKIDFRLFNKPSVNIYLLKNKNM